MTAREPSAIVCDFPTIMDGYVVRWYSSEHDANKGRVIVSASRNAAIVHEPGPAADALMPEAERVHALISDWYGPWGRPASHEKPWQDVLTHTKRLFGDVEPITDGAS
ncbi:MAG TPA: hypothetical protein VHO27_01485 [Angustibacter sp.]|nr:hypothetical protein [Angustibacter sp.]